MNENKKSAKRYHQFMITALKKKVNDMKDSAYSGLYSEIAFIIGIAVIMIDTFFPPEETKANCVWKIILIAVSIVCMFYFAKKVKTVNEVEEEKKFWPNFFIQWATSLGYINMPVAMIAILVTFDKGKAWTADLHILFCRFLKNLNSFSKDIFCVKHSVLSFKILYMIDTNRQKCIYFDIEKHTHAK